MALEELLARLPAEVLFTLISFVGNSVFLTLYFYYTLSDPTSKHSPRRDAFLLALLGSTVGAAFLLAPLSLPSILPHMDVAIGLVIVGWVLLLHYRFDEGWAESILQAAVAAIIYVVILVLMNGLFVLWVSAG